MKIDLSDSLAYEMDKALNNDENKKMFSSASVLEKVAFSRVADEGKIKSELEDELDQKLSKTASVKCSKCEKDEEVCECEKHEKKASVSDSVSALLKVSEDLEANGFEKLAALSIVLAEKLIVEAKSKSKSEKSKSSKKMTMKERMEKMRKMKGKKKDKKDDKKTSKKPVSKTAQQPMSGTPLPQDLTAGKSLQRSAQAVLQALPEAVKAAVARLEADDVNHILKVQFLPGKGSEAIFDAITNTASKVLPHVYKVIEVL